MNVVSSSCTPSYNPSSSIVSESAIQKSIESISSQLDAYAHNIPEEVIHHTLRKAYDAYQRAKGQTFFISRSIYPRIAASIYIDNVSQRIFLLWKKRFGQRNAFNTRITPASIIDPSDGKTSPCLLVQHHIFPPIDLSFLQAFSGQPGFPKIHAIYRYETCKNHTATEITNIITDVYPNALISCSRKNEEKAIALTESQQLKVILDVTHALATMHSTRTIHRDIRPENILFRFEESLQETTAQAALTSFRHAVACDQRWEVPNQYGTERYTSPEVLDIFRFLDLSRTIFPQNFELEAKQDVYALGLSFCSAFFSIAHEDRILHEQRQEIERTLGMSPTSHSARDCASIPQFKNWIMQHYWQLSNSQKEYAQSIIQAAFDDRVHQVEMLMQSSNISPLRKGMLHILQSMIATNPNKRLSSQEALHYFRTLYAQNTLQQLSIQGNNEGE